MVIRCFIYESLKQYKMLKKKKLIKKGIFRFAMKKYWEIMAK